MGAVIAAAIVYVQTYKPKVQQPVVVVQQPVKPKVVVKPARWEQEGVGPGWASGRGLGEGDFKFFGQMDHPFGNQPRYSGHPMQAQPLPWAPRRVESGDKSRRFQSLRTEPALKDYELIAYPTAMAVGDSYNLSSFSSQAPRPPKNDSHGLQGGGYMMPPMGGSMGPTRY
jgi:hypothetical protein